MKNLERKDILNVKKHTKNKSVFNNSQLVLNILYDTSIKYKNNKSGSVSIAILVDSFLNT